ncbi:hypothetical protein [Halodesulfovibrio spirochaetisodalis]|uniref:Capsule polysaccharide biosynthesis protein n=1 Tax=Halodesulfovibrio spirochaetisodalis TaxID=1560234 RepID=A0A1B7XAK5_9BACT|nr:hypothetical protein [Halodesulfovibrio spirochaetisodalis]OBQ46398.1 hypothetical protein SP90_12785 [Halodesulfovibrio spirochaetisodalis]
MSEKKTILILAYHQEIVRFFSDESRYKIVAVAACDFNYDKFKEHLPASASLFRVEDVIYNRDFEFFSQTLVKEFRETQRKVSYFLERLSARNWESDDLYYAALAFWNKFFATTKIDLVLNCHPEFGSPICSIPYAFAARANIPVYSIYTSSYTVYSLLDVAKNELIPLGNVACSKKTLLENSFFQSSSVTDSPWIKKLVKRCIGMVNYEMLVGLVRRISYRTQFGVRIPLYKYYLGYLYSFYLPKAYNRIASEPDLSEKYVFYALHLEPEAATGVRVAVNNQLVHIRMLAKSLPTGWKLYVKEHPTQFRLNREGFTYFLCSTRHFKSTGFYKELADIPNVELVSMSYNSKDLIENSQATASITGTVLLETTMAKKPVFAFEKEVSLFKDGPTCFSITSFGDLQTSFAKLESTSFSESDYEKTIDSAVSFCLPRTYSMDDVMKLLSEKDSRLNWF